LGEGFMLAMKPLDVQASEADVDVAWRAAAVGRSKPQSAPALVVRSRSLTG
jgi:hypothetical protein